MSLNPPMEILRIWTYHQSRWYQLCHLDEGRTAQDGCEWTTSPDLKRTEVVQSLQSEETWSYIKYGLKKLGWEWGKCRKFCCFRVQQETNIFQSERVKFTQKYFIHFCRVWFLFTSRAHSLSHFSYSVLRSNLQFRGRRSHPPVPTWEPQAQDYRRELKSGGLGFKSSSLTALGGLVHGSPVFKPSASLVNSQMYVTSASHQLGFLKMFISVHNICFTEL